MPRGVEARMRYQHATADPDRDVADATAAFSTRGKVGGGHILARVSCFVVD
jgi:hypothetical protein